MQVQVKIDFSSYSPNQIISMIEQGLVTAEEVADSGVADKFFTRTLADYIQTATYVNLGNTVAV